MTKHESKDEEILKEVEHLISIFATGDYGGSHTVDTIKKLRNMEAELVELRKKNAERDLEQQAKGIDSLHSKSNTIESSVANMFYRKKAKELREKAKQLKGEE